MAIELIPSSFRCDCGAEFDFSEGTIREMERMSKAKHVRLGTDDDTHTIVFYDGEAKEILCPKHGKCTIDGFE